MQGILGAVVTLPVLETEPCPCPLTHWIQDGDQVPGRPNGEKHTPPRDPLTLPARPSASGSLTSFPLNAPITFPCAPVSWLRGVEAWGP